jgi:hypothetical protein
MAKKKVVKKQPAKKPTQTQTQNVNVYYGTKPKGKSKPKKRQPKKVKRDNQIFNQPPIINFPPQYKPYAVYPEGETAKIFNLNSAVPVPLKIETETQLLNAPITAPNLAKLVDEPVREEPFVEDDVSVLTEAPEFADLPEEARSQVLDLPPAEAAALIENKESLFDPFNLPVPASGRSLAESVASAQSIAEPPSIAPSSVLTPQFSDVGITFTKRRTEPLPPIKAEKSELPFSPLASSGLTLPPPIPAAKPKPYFGEEPPPAEEKRKGRPKGAKNKPKEEPTQTLFSVFPITANVEPLRVPIQIGQREEEGFKFSPPLSQLGGQYEFIGQPKQPTEKETNPLERRRTGGVLSAAEEAIIGGIPTFIA